MRLNFKMNIKMIRKDWQVPKRETEGAVGYDLQANLEGMQQILIPAKSSAVIKLGMAFQIPTGIVGDLHPRSSMFFKKDLIIGNGVGIIDSDFRGELGIKLYNSGINPVYINDGDRIAQIVFRPVYLPMLESVEELTVTKRGEGGFGSTGTGQ